MSENYYTCQHCGCYVRPKETKFGDCYERWGRKNIQWREITVKAISWTGMPTRKYIPKTSPVSKMPRETCPRWLSESGRNKVEHAEWLLQQEDIKNMEVS
jgi:hypothetical protein